MAKIAIVFGTTEGHTRKIAEQIGDWLEGRHQLTLIDSSDVPPAFEAEEYDAFILAGSLHQEKHQSSLVHFATKHREALHRRPTAFLSVSLTAVIKDEKHDRDCRRCMDMFYEETGWYPTVDTPVAGALKYTQYDFFKRMLMRMIAGKEGGDTDTSRDYEYTDWKELRLFIEKFVAKLPEGVQLSIA